MGERLQSAGETENRERGTERGWRRDKRRTQGDGEPTKGGLSPRLLHPGTLPSHPARRPLKKPPSPAAFACPPHRRAPSPRHLSALASDPEPPSLPESPAVRIQRVILNRS